jgi:hypothetical protein
MAQINELHVARNFRLLMSLIPETKYRKWHREYQIPTSKRACYLKEARAILDGKDARFKNRCNYLVGD